MRRIKNYPTNPAVGRRLTAEQFNYYVGHGFLLAGLVLISAVLVWLGFKASRVYGAYQTILNEAVSIQTTSPATSASAIKETDTAALADSLRRIEAQLTVIETEGQPFFALGPYLGALPWMKADLQAVPQLVASSKTLIRAGLVMFDVVEPALALEDNTEFLPIIANNLAAAQPEIKALTQDLEHQQQTLSQIRRLPMSSAVAPRAEQLYQVTTRAVNALQFIQYGPTLLGVDSPKTYLILTPNSDELRPSGGYITTAGHLTIDQGHIVEFIMQDSYAVDNLSDSYPYPPDPLLRYMGAQYWVLRDAGWSPHFPETAQTAIDLYTLGQGLTADGVISLDQHALRLLVKSMEPVEVEHERVTSANLIPLLHQKWAPEDGQPLDGKWWRQRKSFLTALASAIRDRLEYNPGTINLPLLVQGFYQALQEKHALIYVSQPGVEDYLVQQNLAGTVVDTEGDYLMTVSANVGFNKASAAVDQQLDYEVVLAADGQARAEATLMLHHQAPKRPQPCSIAVRYAPVYEQNMQRCYWNYLRLLVPVHSHLIQGPNLTVEGQYLLDGQRTTGQVDVSPISTKMSWGQLLLLAPGESQTVSYAYTLPPGTVKRHDDEWLYRLYLQKQPGTLSSPVQVSVVLPAGAQPINSRPEPATVDATTLTYRLDLNKDQTVQLTYTVSQ
ncbi:MAG: DUF4012 domain-containing protein [Anaerolineae bacterium]|nr:DUF4012 domain-containing protein [Anaerolineae bacterium]